MSVLIRLRLSLPLAVRNNAAAAENSGSEDPDILHVERLLALLAGFFGVVALIASCLGIYGVTAFQVTRRTNEIGVRIALGARGSHVVWTVLSEILALLAAGIGIGIPAALLFTRFAKNLLFGLSAADPTTYVIAATLLGLVAVAAGAIPATRATRVDPMTALRYE